VQTRAHVSDDGVRRARRVRRRDASRSEPPRLTRSTGRDLFVFVGRATAKRASAFRGVHG
jgi:hypothetical protein